MILSTHPLQTGITSCFSPLHLLFTSHWNPSLEMYQSLSPTTKTSLWMVVCPTLCPLIPSAHWWHTTQTNNTLLPVQHLNKHNCWKLHRHMLSHQFSQAGLIAGSQCCLSTHPHLIPVLMLSNLCMYYRVWEHHQTREFQCQWQPLLYRLYGGCKWGVWRS